MLVGVQSNQFPRALDSRGRCASAAFRSRSAASTSPAALACCRRRSADLDRARAMGVSLFAGEAEGRLDEVLRDAERARSSRSTTTWATCRASKARRSRSARSEGVAHRGRVTSFDAGRGCPFQCSFCTIINVQGRKSRRRSPTTSKDRARQCRAGICTLLHHRRQFRAQQGLGAIFDRLIQLREARDQDPPHHPGRHALPQDPELHREGARAGVTRVFIGLENINPDSLVAAKKRQNKITEYRKMLLAWKSAASSPTPATSSASRTTPGVDPARATSRSSSASCRSTPRVLLPDAAAGLRGSLHALGTATSATLAFGSFSNSDGASRILLERLPPPMMMRGCSITRSSM
jgi:hypothetical protein